ncbi:restriction system protein [Paracoccus isoporae]|uniref:Restriction system protein n=1 Tax=Paracoccus isoporae TaxID=591205 RepID=A0A1G6WXG0_9RHOB|nr:restriction endonuclease [Paracoccus isoporae]SDD69867.1 restriction system protein [Paracoccus isoporae]
MSRRFVIEAEGLPDLAGMMLVTVEALRSIGGSATIHELDERVAEIEGVSEEEQAFMMTGDGHRPRLNYFLSWARTYLRRGGAVENSARGVWALTERGQGITTYQQTQEIRAQVAEEEREKARQKRMAEKAQPAPDAELPEPDPSDDDDLHATDWENELLEVVKKMTPDAFERLAQRLLRESGFIKVEVRGKSGDGGIDGVGVLRVNLISFQVLFQCKRWKSSVGASEIRDFRGALQGRADKGLFITTGSFTSQASEEATRDGAPAIDLIDGDRLCELLKDLGLGVKTELIEKVTVDSGWFEGI